MAGKLTKQIVKKAIKECDGTYLALSIFLGVSPITVKRFMWLEKNEDVYEIFKERQLNIENSAIANIEDAINHGDIKTSKWYVDYLRKVKEQEEGKNINIDGQLGLNLTIKDFKNEND